LYPVLCNWRVQGGWGYTALRPVLSMLESLRWLGVYCFASGAFCVGEFKVGGGILLCVRCFLCWRVQGGWECPALYPVLCNWRVQGEWGYTARNYSYIGPCAKRLSEFGGICTTDTYD